MVKQFLSELPITEVKNKKKSKHGLVKEGKYFGKEWGNGKIYRNNVFFIFPKTLFPMLLLIFTNVKICLQKLNSTPKHVSCFCNINSTTNASLECLRGSVNCYLSGKQRSCVLQSNIDNVWVYHRCCDSFLSGFLKQQEITICIAFISH